MKTLRRLSGRRPRFFAAAFTILVISASVAQAGQEAKPPRPSLEVQAIESPEIPLPAEFQMAMYENLISELSKTKRYEHVYRDGDKQAGSDPNLETLKVTLRGFKKGSAEARQVTTVAGTTSINAHVDITDAKGQSVLSKDVSGKVHFFGENLRATYNFAKAVAAQIRKEPQ